MEYKTVEGHKIEVGECYETRDGRKAFVHRFDDTHAPVDAIISYEAHGQSWMQSGRFWKDMESAEDLMRPWKQKYTVIDEKINKESADNAHCMEEVLILEKARNIKGEHNGWIIKFEGKHYYGEMLDEALKAIFERLNGDKQ